MSPTRKPKPPDKGAPPEHKPSRKVALEEVMRSLQDLVSNELATEPAEQASTAAASPKPRVTAKNPAAFTASPQPTETTSAETTPEDESITLEGLPDYDVTPPPLEPKPATTKPATRAGGPSTTPFDNAQGRLRTGLQQELPYLDTLPPLPVANTPEAVAETHTQAMTPVEMPTAESAAGSFRLDALPAAALTGNHVQSDITPLSVTETPAAPADKINWDDIPVLEEAVDMSEEFYAHETTHAPDATAPLPPAEAARRLAIQVAARLNVELRKSGQGGLSSDIITRLARLLQEALAKGASNMENTTAKDGGSAGNAGAVFRPTPDKH